MSSTMAPNVRGVGTPGRRTVYSMCDMCSVRCPIEVTVEDGRVTWLQGNPHDRAIGTSLCAKGSAGLAFEYDDERPHTPLIRKGPRGGRHDPRIFDLKNTKHPDERVEAWLRGRGGLRARIVTDGVLICGA
jgi:hypothetical protein